MSRTLSHVPYKHWNVREPHISWGYDDEQFETHGKRGGKLKPGATREWVVDMVAEGVELTDLRFYAGCRRVPQVIRKTRASYTYAGTWGHCSGVARGIAKEIAGSDRAAVRTYGRAVAKAYRSGGDVDDYLEPDGRTRHAAIWLAN